MSSKPNHKANDTNKDMNNDTKADHHDANFADGDSKKEKGSFDDITPDVVIKNPHAKIASSVSWRDEVAENDTTSEDKDTKKLEMENGDVTTEEKEKFQSVSVSELFQFADKVDYILMIFGTIAAIGNGVAQPCSFIVFGKLINEFINNDSGRPINLNDKMEFFAALYCYLAIATIVCGYFQNMLWAQASIRQAFLIRRLCFKSILRQDIGWFDTTDSGELSTRLADDITKIQEGIGDKIGSVQQAISMLLAGVIIGFAYSWKLTLVIIATSPVMVIAAYTSGKVISKLTSEEQSAYAKAGSIAEEVFSSIRTVVAFGGEEKEISRYRERLADAERAGIKKGLSSGFAFGLFNAVIFSSCALGFWYGGRLVAEGEIQGGDLLIVFFCVLIGAAQFGQVGPNIESFAKARGAAFHIYEYIHRTPTIDSLSSLGATPPIMGRIDFIDCCFNYPSRPQVPILNGFNLMIPPGLTVALVGESGCGKSTTIKLAQRFYDVLSGKVLIDGHDIRSLNVAHLRRHIGVVSQEPVLFEMSIRDNILMGNKSAAEEMVENACKDANAWNFIKALPQQLDTHVGEGGAQLSGGQKQRIAIARALVRDPKILLLDEATSALDTESESIVQAALDKASEGRTTVIIAHRLSTVRRANMIVAVEDGHVAEMGTHDELMAKKGVYHKLVMLQTMAEQAEEEDEEISSVISEEERVQRIQKKLLRSISQLSAGGAEEKTAAVQLSRLISRRGTVTHMVRGVSTTDKKKQKKVKEKEKEELPEDVPIPSMWRIFKLNLKEWPYMLIGVFFAAGAGGMPVVFAIILAEVLQSFSFNDKDKMRRQSEFWSLMFLALGLGIGICCLIAQYLFAVAGEALTTRLREMSFRAVLRQEIGFFDDPRHSTGALTARLASDASGVQGATSTRLNTLTQVLVMGLSSLIIAFIYSWKLTLLVVGFIPLMAFAGAVQTKLNTSFAEDEKKKISSAGATATESIMHIRTVASIGQELHFYNLYESSLHSPQRDSKKSAHFYGLSFGFAMGIMFFCNASSFRLGGYLAEKDGLTISDIMKVIIAVQFGAMTAGQLASFAPDYLKAKISAGRILAIFDRVPSVDSYSPAGLKDVELSGKVQFSAVSFHYPTRPDVQVLNGLTVEIHPGQSVAFVGASGCGKSTCISLIERFYDVAGGSLFLDQTPIGLYNIKWLRSQIGIVQQEPVLFDRSIEENILYGVPEGKPVTHEQVVEACKSANIHHFIMDLPQGYATKVGDKGTLISGGQKQRIAIARALIRNPKILLLDEATSALDSESEKVVQAALDVAMQGRTSIIIAHRLSTIQNADVIAVMQGGKVIEVGNHHQLLDLKGAYYLLTQAQM